MMIDPRRSPGTGGGGRLRRLVSRRAPRFQAVGAILAPAKGVDPVLAERHRLRSDVLLTFGSRTITGLGVFAASVVAARELGPSGRGLMAVALTLNVTLMQVGHLGLVSANPFFVARNPTAVSRIISNSLAWAVMLGGTLIGAVVAIKLAVPNLIPGLGWSVTLIALLVLPAALAALLLQGVLLGEGRMIAYSVPQAALSLATVAGLLIFAAVSDLTVAGAVTLMIVQWLVAAPLYYVLATRHREKSVVVDFSLAREMISYALRIYAATVLAFLVIRFDLFLVNGYLGARQAGLYSVAAIIAEAMFFLPVAIGVNIFFRVARGDAEQLTAFIFRSMIVLYAALCLLAAIVAGPLIPLLFGESFADSVGLFYWLIPGIFSFGMLTILSYHFAGRGYPREAVLYWVVGFVLNVALNVSWLSEVGTYFAALSASITYTIIFVLHVQLFARDVGWKALRPRLEEVSRVVSAVLGSGRA
jgi:O-antigen/teichoic acid export membrane protein